MTIDQQNTAPTATPTHRGPVMLALIGAAGVAVGVIGTLGVQSVVQASAVPALDTRFAEAVEECSPRQGVELADGETTLIIDVQGDEDSQGATYGEQACILDVLDIPSRISSHIGQTTSMDGRQTASWDGITVEWSYHPNRGSDMVLTLDAE